MFPRSKIAVNCNLSLCQPLTYPGPGCGGSVLRRKLWPLSPQPLKLTLPVSPQGVPSRQTPSLQCILGLPLPNRACLKQLAREVSRRHPNQISKAHQLVLLDKEKQQLHTKFLVDEQTSVPISKKEPSHPTKEAHFDCLYPQPYFFRPDSKVMTIDQSHNVDWPVNQELYLAAQLPLCHDRLV